MEERLYKVWKEPRKTRICPFMSRPVTSSGEFGKIKPEFHEQDCLEGKCMAWKEILIETNSKNYRQYGCVLLKEPK